MNIIVKGTLDRSAEHRVDSKGDSFVLLSIAGTCNGWPVETRVLFGQDHAAAVRYTQRIPKGAHVTIECEGALPRTDHSTAALVLRRVIRLDVRTDSECFVVPGLLR